MDMRAVEDIAVGEDLTPPLPPLAAVLHDSAVSSYCSACFSTLPLQPFPPSALTFPQNSSRVPSATPTPLYCSPTCSSIDSSLHFSSAEHHLLSLFSQSPPSTWTDSSDLRLSLRLVYIFQNLPIENKYKSMENVLERIGGLMTNREKLIFEESTNNQFQGENLENVLERIREGAKIMAKARRMCVNEDEDVENQEDFVLEEMLLCLVMTNGVEVQDKSGINIGIAVYDAAFSWINHSCSPNACYRFQQGIDQNEQAPFRIMGGDLKWQPSERNGYGPRVVVRSIKAVSKGEEVTIAYTDLLQTREMRRAELWLKYRFNCICKRCATVPIAYVDCALQALSADNPDLDIEIEKLMKSFDDAVNDYLSYDNPKSCCKKLENLLSHGNLSENFLEPKESKLPQKVKLHPFHHLSLNAYTTLASAFRVEASDLLALNYDIEEHKLEAFNKCKISSAYSLLLAGVVNHLYMFESSLVTTVANFWINAGESLLNLARNPLWDSFLKRGSINFDLSPFLNLKCNDCRLVDTLETICHQKLQLEQIKSRLYNCIANIIPKVWRILSSESHFLNLIQNPIDVSWLESPEIPDAESCQFEAEESSEQLRMNLILLSIHCLRYGSQYPMLTELPSYLLCEVMQLMKTLTFNVICTVLFGIERGERREKLVNLFKQVMDGMLAVPINFPFTRFNRSLRARSKAEEIIRELIHEKREKQSLDQDLITRFLSMRDETDSPLFTDEEIIDNCVIAMIAGHDTTSILLTFLIKLLSENPQVYDTVLKEQEEIARGKSYGELLTWDDLSKMKYTWRVATEALRMYPPVFFSFRQVLKDIEMGGYIIPKGWQVLWAGCMTHMDESIFPDPNKFNPSRFEKSGAIPPHAFVAFGGGPRMCPGNEFARIETLTMIHYLVTGFRWKLCLEENVMSRDPMPVFKEGLPILIERKTSINSV